MLLTQLLVDEIRSLRRDKTNPAWSTDRARVIRLADRATRSSAPVLIEGEPGTGGDAVSRAIHDCGDRKGRPFIRVHVDTLGADAGLALFGEETASGARRGKVLEAHGARS